MVDSKLLQKAYYDPKTGFISANKLYKKIQEKGFTGNLQDVRDWLNKQEVQQITKQKGKLIFNKTVATGIGQSTQADLLDIQKFKRTNKGYRFILFVIDIYSRYVFAKPLKSKKKKEVANAFEEILQQIPIQSLNTDDGPEFTNNVFKSLLKDYNIKHFVKTSEIKGGNTGVIERFNRTFRQILERVNASNGNTKWLEYLDDIVMNYNSNYHKTLMKSPKSIFDGKEINDNQKYRSGVKQFYPEQNVRILLNKSKFAKGVAPKWSKEIYTVREKDGLGYRLLNKQRKYFGWEFQLVKEVENRLSDNKEKDTELRRNRTERLLRKEGLD
jgi:hypothetical protein